MAKSHVTSQKRKYFNKTDYINFSIVSESLLSTLNDVAKKYNAPSIKLEVSEYPKWGTVQWSWRYTFFQEYYLKSLDFELQEHNVYFYRYWLDQLVFQCSIMVANLVNSTLLERYKETDVPQEELKKLPRKQRNVSAYVESIMNSEVREFDKHFA